MRGHWRVICLGLLTCHSLLAATIFSNTAGAETGAGFWGQSITTPAGGPWNNIRFNLFDAVGGGPRAGGQLFVLTSEYLGAPQDLSAATPGFFASTPDILLPNVWFFAPGVVLAPSTQYFFYTSVSLFVLASSANPFAQGIAYEAFGADQNYFPIPIQDVNFLLVGDVVGEVPEPAALLLTGIGLAILALLRRIPRHARCGARTAGRVDNLVDA